MHVNFSPQLTASQKLFWKITITKQKWTVVSAIQMYLQVKWQAIKWKWSCFLSWGKISILNQGPGNTKSS